MSDDTNEEKKPRVVLKNKRAGKGEDIPITSEFVVVVDGKEFSFEELFLRLVYNVSAWET